MYKILYSANVFKELSINKDMRKQYFLEFVKQFREDLKNKNIEFDYKIFLKFQDE